MTISSAADLVEKYLMDQIQNASFQPGSKLPTERKLSQELSVSRAVVRAAIERLEARNLVTRQQGRGTFIGSNLISVGMGAVKISFSPAEIMDARFNIEPSICREAALRADVGDIDEIRTAMSALEDVVDNEGYEAADMRFHHSIALGTRNRIFVLISETLTYSRVSNEWSKTRRRNFDTRRVEQSLAEHRDILEAIRGRSPSDAAAAMERHLISVKASFSKSADTL